MTEINDAREEGFRFFRGLFIGGFISLGLWAIIIGGAWLLVR
jgi:hypothetical protein